MANIEVALGGLGLKEAAGLRMHNHGGRRSELNINTYRCMLIVGLVFNLGTYITPLSSTEHIPAMTKTKVLLLAILPLLHSSVVASPAVRMDNLGCGLYDGKGDSVFITTGRVVITSSGMMFLFNTGPSIFKPHANLC